MSLRQRIPDHAVLLSLAPEELASQLLSVLPTRVQNGVFNRDAVSSLAADYQQQHDDVELAVGEAWRWLERVWAALARGDYGDAVFLAFRAVEECVRKAGAYADTEIGVELMRRAFDAAKGPLAKQTDPKPEREVLAHLFAGAIGSYKNPHSHRTVTITDAGEAQEMVMLASHLLRIVDARKPQ